MPDWEVFLLWDVSVVFWAVLVDTISGANWLISPCSLSNCDLGCVVCGLSDPGLKGSAVNSRSSDFEASAT